MPKLSQSWVWDSNPETSSLLKWLNFLLWPSHHRLQWLHRLRGRGGFCIWPRFEREEHLPQQIQRHIKEVQRDPTPICQMEGMTNNSGMAQAIKYLGGGLGFNVIDLPGGQMTLKTNLFLLIRLIVYYFNRIMVVKSRKKYDKTRKLKENFFYFRIRHIIARAVFNYSAYF